MRISIFKLTLCFLAAGSPAQTVQPISEGPFAGMSHGLSVDSGTYSGTVNLDKRALYIRSVGTPSPMPAEADGSRYPDLRVSSILGATGGATQVDVNAKSLGFDLIIADSLGKAVIPANTWVALNLSTTKTSVGEEGGTIRQESLRADGPGADVFSLVLPGSTGVDPFFVNRLLRSQDSTESKLFGNNARGEIDAIDTIMSLYSLSPAFVASLPILKKFYFAVSDATKQHIPTSWLQGTKRSGATIFVAELINGSWATPKVFRSYVQNGLGENEDIDALSIDSFRNLMLLSTTTSTRDQILVSSLNSTTPTLAPYKTKDGDLVSKRVGLLQTDDIDGICSLDPTRPEGLYLRHALGTPVGAITATTMNVTVFRRFEDVSPTPKEYFTTYLLGWKPGGVNQPGWAAAFAQWPGQSPLLLGVYSRTPYSSPGDPQSHTEEIPQNASMQGITIGVNWLLGDHLGQLATYMVEVDS